MRGRAIFAPPPDRTCADPHAWRWPPWRDNRRPADAGPWGMSWVLCSLSRSGAQHGRPARVYADDMDILLIVGQQALNGQAHVPSAVHGMQPTGATTAI